MLIVVRDNKYYEYEDPRFQHHTPPLNDEGLYAHSALDILQQLRVSLSWHHLSILSVKLNEQISRHGNSNACDGYGTADYRVHNSGAIYMML